MPSKERQTLVGSPISRLEDQALLTGKGQFVADISPENTAHVAFLRSNIAHGNIDKITTSQLTENPNILLAVTGRDIEGALPPINGMQVKAPEKWANRVAKFLNIPSQPLMANQKVRYVGEALAMVVATSKNVAEDSLEDITYSISELSPVTDPVKAVTKKENLIHDSIPNNKAAILSDRKGDCSQALANAKNKIKRRFKHHRYAAMPMECRSVLADYDLKTEFLTVWSSTQVVHWLKRELSIALQIPEEKIRCIAPDVGGGFGGKGHVYPEEILVAWAAKFLARPVQWIEDRGEHILNSAHSRDCIIDTEIGFDDEGKIVALKNEILIDSGAYTPVGAGVISNSIAHSLGPYAIDHFEANCVLSLTNKAPNAPYRGAGRPEVCFSLERAIDCVARELHMEPTEVRLKNMVPPESMPFEVGLTYRDGEPIVYDSGDYPSALKKTIETLGGLKPFRVQQSTALKLNRLLGIGFASYVEGTGVGPFEGVKIKIDTHGDIRADIGACAQGQGHKTIFAQVLSDEWEVPIERISITHSDTEGVRHGYGTIASRSTVTAGNGLIKASEALKKKILSMSAEILEADEGDLEIVSSTVRIKGVPGSGLNFQDLIEEIRPGWKPRHNDYFAEPLEASSLYYPPTVTWSYASHGAVVEIDADTGHVELVDYAVTHDAGRLINPTLAEGQVIGGTVQGIGAILCEEVIYDPSGQNITANFTDYTMPRADIIPHITLVHSEIPSPLNKLGVKGLGEGGAIAPPAAIANAISDALSPLGYELNESRVRIMDLVKALDNRQNFTKASA